MSKLFLDDIRDVLGVDWTVNKIGHQPCKFPAHTWIDAVIVRDYNEFVRYITQHGIPDEVSFDHDLADIHYANFLHTGQWDIDEQAMKLQLTEKTGYDCAVWLIQTCIDKQLKLPGVIYVHSFNPVGKQKITDVITSAKRNFKFL
jgi:hypothetical protein